MKKLSFSILFLVLLAFSPSPVQSATQESTGDFLAMITSIVSDELIKAKLSKILDLSLPIKPSPSKCEYCTMLTGTALNYCKLNNVTIDEFFMHRFCPMFPSEMKVLCDEFMKTAGPIIINSLMNFASPDIACRQIGVCENKQCTLFPKGFHDGIRVSETWKKFQRAEGIPPQSPSKPYTILEKLSKMKDTLIGRLFSGKVTTEEITTLMSFIERLERTGESPFDWIKELINQWTGNHTTPIDLDHDSFSSLTAVLRGYNWRGRDCNDYDAKTYPGRKTDPHQGTGRDYNCNGIKGINPKTKVAYKDELCKNSGQLGVVVMGDSAGAHAEIPLQWFDATLWNENTFKGIIETVLNEVDLPHMSAYTGYADVGIMGPVRSVYKSLYQRNKCNFRDYQNIAVNGAKSGNCFGNNERLSRSKTDDHPILMFLELVGNDVCNHRPTFDVMTKPDEFRKNIIKNLDYLDSVVPAGSHLVILGVANGSLIYEGVSGRVHPVGVTYEKLYDYQNCLESSFCWGWLNTNETIRTETTRRAEELNQVYRDLTKTYKPKNFDFVYYDFPVPKIFGEYVAAGGDPFDLIEATDGFHPSQIFHAKLGDYLWETLENEHADWLGPVNPNNDLITQLFGNQGGY